MGNGTQDAGKPGRSLLSWVIPYNLIPYILYYIHAYSLKKSVDKDRVKACFQNFRVERDQIIYCQSFHCAGEEIEVQGFKYFVKVTWL